MSSVEIYAEAQLVEGVGYSLWLHVFNEITGDAGAQHLGYQTHRCLVEQQLVAGAESAKNLLTVGGVNVTMPHEYKVAPGPSYIHVSDANG